MPRPVSIRVSYRDDAAFLLRLETAVSKDTRQTPAWRVRTTRVARSLALRLLEADARMNMGKGDLPGVGRSVRHAKRRSSRPESRAGVATQ
jgi:hypothetical protein